MDDNTPVAVRSVAELAYAIISASSGDPKLGERVEPEDGSPAYYPLLPGSPAIDAAHRHFCTDSDQIGTYRPYKSFAGDIGAIEYVFDD